MPKITLDEFLDELFHDRDPDGEEIFFSERNGLETTGWPYATRDMIQIRIDKGMAKAMYTSISTVDPVNLKRKKATARRLHIIPLDDIGTKVQPNPVKPTAVIETSAGNQQWLYALEQPVDDPDLADRIIRTVYGDANLTDTGGAQITKVIRLPW